MKEAEMARRKTRAKGTWSRRQVLLTGAAAGAAAIGGGITLSGQGRGGGRGGGPPADVPPGQARKIATGDFGLVNGVFVDGRGIVASAMTIKSGRIADVGRMT